VKTDPAYIDPACGSVVAALEDDPFYRSISEELAGDVTERRSVLTRYFAYSIEEGRALGRTVHLADPSRGVAVWLLPQPDEIRTRAAAQKRQFLANTLGARGTRNYYRMVEFMSDKSQALARDRAWYLSIIAVDPSLHGRGLGQQLLAPTLMEADTNGAVSYLETFGLRTVRFYERLGFATLGRFDEPTTGAQYALMVRHPQQPHP
jgi:GNAT superfamily N-acetyltransferase